MRINTLSGAALVSLIATLCACATPEERCQDGIASACVFIAERVAKGYYTSDKPAATWHEMACNMGQWSSCNEAGWAFYEGQGVEKDMARSAKLYARGCDNGDALACGNLGYMLENGFGVDQNHPLAAEKYAISCKAQWPNACFSLGIAYELGRGVDQDLTRARELYDFGCTKENVSACVNLGVLLMNGQGGPVEIEQATALLTKACEQDGNAWGCANLGVLHEHGRGDTKKDACRAMDLYAKACDQDNNPVGCANLAAGLVSGLCNRRDNARALQLLEPTCNNQGGDACAHLGWLLMEGKGVPKDLPRAKALLTKACHQDSSAPACRHLASMTEDKAEKARLLHMACDDGSPMGCQALAKELRAQGDQEGAARATERACLLTGECEE